MPDPQIDLSAGLVPKSGGIDLSAGLVPRGARTLTPPAEPEGFWHSLGTQLKGALESPLTAGGTVSPQTAAAMASSAMDAFSQIAHPVVPGTTTPMYVPPEMQALHVTAGLTAPIGGAALEKTLEQTEERNYRGAAGTAAGAAIPIVLGSKLAKLGTTRAPATNPTEALATFVDDRGSAIDPHDFATEIKPLLDRQAVTDNLNISGLEGRAAGKAVLKTVQNAVNTQANQISQINAQVVAEHGDPLVDTTPIAEAYLKQRTPELVENDPAAAERLLGEAKKFADVSEEGQVIGAKPQPLSQVDDFRVRLNNETNATQAKGEGAYRRTGWETKADVNAVAAARDVQYQNLSRLSGQPEPLIRSLFRNEGQLLEFRDGLTRQVNEISGKQAEHVTGSLRANPPGSGRFSTTAREKVGHTYPSHHGVTRSAIREVIGPAPIDVFNNHLKLAFSRTPRQVQAPQSPTATTTAPRLQGPERAAAVSAVMSSLKQGTITQQEADSRIQKINGGGGRKLIRFPQEPQ